MIDLTNERILLTGGTGFLGRHVCAELLKFTDSKNIHAAGKTRYDLRFINDVRELYKEVNPTVIIHLAAKCGGIQANRKHPAHFLQDNLLMGLNLLMATDVFWERLHKFVFVGTTCMYPDQCPVPFREADLWNGYPTASNAPYGVAKRSVMELIRCYADEFQFPGITLIPANLYGPGDSFDDEKSHVIPALIKRFCNAVDNQEDEVVVWGTGNATREFLYAPDAAEAIVRAAMQYESPEPMNIGSGESVSIAVLAHSIAVLCGFNGKVTFDTDQPDGQMRRQLDVSRAKEWMHWEASTPLGEGLRATIEWYGSNRDSQ